MACLITATTQNVGQVSLRLHFIEHRFCLYRCAPLLRMTGETMQTFE